MSQPDALFRTFSQVFIQNYVEQQMRLQLPCLMFGPPPFPQQCPAPAAEEKKKGSQSQAAVPGKKGLKKFAKKGGKWQKKELVSEARLDSAENPDSALPQACAPN